MRRKLSSSEIGRKRAIAAIPGYLVGFCVGMLISRLVEGRYFGSIPFMVGFGGASLALLIGQRWRNIPTPEDLASARYDELKESVNPLGLSSRAGSADAKERTEADDQRSR